MGPKGFHNGCSPAGKKISLNLPFLSAGKNAFSPLQACQRTASLRRSISGIKRRSGLPQSGSSHGARGAQAKAEDV